MSLIILKNVRDYKCVHGKFEVNDELDYVSCGICGEHLNPMFVLKNLASLESRYNVQIGKLLKKAKEAESKNRCKCEHCGKMTKIQKT